MPGGQTKHKLTIPKPLLISLSLKALWVWLVLSGLGWYFQNAIGQTLLPIYEVIIRLLTPEFSSGLKIISQGHEQIIQLNLRLLRPFAISRQYAFPAGKEFQAGSHLIHALVPIIIELTVLLVWPVQTVKHRLILLALGFISVFPVSAAITPALLLGLIEINFQEAASSIGVSRPEPWILSWMLFCEGGGRWLLPLVAAGFCIFLQNVIPKPRNWAIVPF